jgi:uroporphyrin-III C-methyltransferase / precorrin-2 dehydrogenase / sirohydrochlorin ferrochelatase
VHSLPIFLRLQGRPVMLIGDSAAAHAKRRLLERAGAMIVDEGADSQLAIVALDDPDATVARLKTRGILVNAVDRPDLCDFTLPAIVDRDPVLVAIGTGGASAGLAKALRQRLEAFLPATLGGLALRLFAARAALRQRWPEPSDRRRAIDAALSEGGALDLLSGRIDVSAWLAEGGEPSPGTRVEIALTSADPDDLTLRQARLLASADRIYHAADVPEAILNRARADATRICGAAPLERGSGLTIDLRMV